MAWIESHQGLARHIKTKRFARKLGVTIPAAIGHLHLLWWWAMDNLPDGNISQMEPEDIADEMMWDGDAEHLVQSLSDSGFLDTTDQGLIIHDWHDYIGRLLERRKKETERKRNYRRKSERNPEDDPSNSKGRPAGQDADDTRDGGGNSTVQYHTLNNTTTDPADDFEKVRNSYINLHSVLDMPIKDYPYLTALLKEGFPADLIIEVMKDKKKKEGKVNSIKYYEEAIRERHDMRNRVVSMHRKDKRDPELIARDIEIARNRWIEEGNDPNDFIYRPASGH